MPRRMRLLVAGLVMLTGCSNSVSHAFTTQTTTTQAPPVTTPVLPVTPAQPIAFTGATFGLYAAGDVRPGVPEEAWVGVLDTLNRYLEAGVLTPLRSGGPAGDLAPLFTRPAAERVTTDTPDRKAFIDENLPAVGDLRQEAAVASLAGLADADGDMSVVTAELDLRLIGHIAGAPVTVVRSGELVLVPDGDTWRIDAYDLKVVRRLAEDTTATTVRS